MTTVDRRRTTVHISTSNDQFSRSPPPKSILVEYNIWGNKGDATYRNSNNPYKRAPADYMMKFVLEPKDLDDCTHAFNGKYVIKNGKKCWCLGNDGLEVVHKEMMDLEIHNWIFRGVHSNKEYNLHTVMSYCFSVGIRNCDISADIINLCYRRHLLNLFLDNFDVRTELPTLSNICTTRDGVSKIRISGVSTVANVTYCCAFVYDLLRTWKLNPLVVLEAFQEPLPFFLTDLTTDSTTNFRKLFEYEAAKVVKRQYTRVFHLRNVHMVDPTNKFFTQLKFFITRYPGLRGSYMLSLVLLYFNPFA